MLASVPRCDREVRCKTGAAPATVSGEPAATPLALLHPERVGTAPRALTPSQETSASPPRFGFWGERDRSSGGGVAFVIDPTGGIAPADPGAGRCPFGQKPLCRDADRDGRRERHLLRHRGGR